MDEESPQHIPDAFDNTLDYIQKNRPHPRSETDMLIDTAWYIGSHLLLLNMFRTAVNPETNAVEIIAYIEEVAEDSLPPPSLADAAKALLFDLKNRKLRVPPFRDCQMDSLVDWAHVRATDWYKEDYNLSDDQATRTHEFESLMGESLNVDWDSAKKRLRDFNPLVAHLQGRLNVIQDQIDQGQAEHHEWGIEVGGQAAAVLACASIPLARWYNTDEQAISFVLIAGQLLYDWWLKKQESPA